MAQNLKKSLTDYNPMLYAPYPMHFADRGALPADVRIAFQAF
jgi:hypothetical protein